MRRSISPQLVRGETRGKGSPHGLWSLGGGEVYNLDKCECLKEREGLSLVLKNATLVIRLGGKAPALLHRGNGKEGGGEGTSKLHRASWLSRVKLVLKRDRVDVPATTKRFPLLTAGCGLVYFSAALSAVAGRVEEGTGN